MISEFKKINKLFEEINEFLNKKVYFFIIGGTMLLYHGIKPATKDIDIIIETEEEFFIIQNTLRKIGFMAKLPTSEYKKMELNQIFVREDFRIDLFKKTVFKGFSLSDAMKKRAKKILELGYLTVSLCSNEDVFLFKTFTEREGDLEDCIALAKKGIYWNVILDELRSQIKLSGNKIWITWVGERFDILEERGLVIPIMNELNILRKNYFENYGKRKKLN